MYKIYQQNWMLQDEVCNSIPNDFNETQHRGKVYTKMFSVHLHHTDFFEGFRSLTQQVTEMKPSVVETCLHMQKALYQMCGCFLIFVLEHFFRPMNANAMGGRHQYHLQNLLVLKCHNHQQVSLIHVAAAHMCQVWNADSLSFT